jgi:hypothetical protein
MVIKIIVINIAVFFIRLFLSQYHFNLDMPNDIFASAYQNCKPNKPKVLSITTLKAILA